MFVTDGSGSSSSTATRTAPAAKPAPPAPKPTTPTGSPSPKDTVHASAPETESGTNVSHVIAGLHGEQPATGEPSGDGGDNPKTHNENPNAPDPTIVPPSGGGWTPPSGPTGPQSDPQSAAAAKAYVQAHAYKIGPNGQHVPLDATEQQALEASFARYPSKDIQALNQHKIPVILADPSTPAKYLPNNTAFNKNWGGVFFSGSHPAIVLRQDYLDESDPTSRVNDTNFVASHEAAHAIDFIEGKNNNFHTAEDPRAQQLYNQYVAETKNENPNTGANVIDPGTNNYATTSVQEFFAEGARQYVTDPSLLEQADPQLYAYEQQEINNNNPPPPPSSPSIWQTLFGWL